MQSELVRLKPLSLHSTLEILTEELIISQADYDYSPTDEKLDHISSLEIKIQEALRWKFQQTAAFVKKELLGMISVQ